jgi:hypothetical protein
MSGNKTSFLMVYVYDVRRDFHCVGKMIATAAGTMVPDFLMPA